MFVFDDEIDVDDFVKGSVKWVGCAKPGTLIFDTNLHPRSKIRLDLEGEPLSFADIVSYCGIPIEAKVVKRTETSEMLLKQFDDLEKNNFGKPAWAWAREQENWFMPRPWSQPYCEVEPSFFKKVLRKFLRK